MKTKVERLGKIKGVYIIDTDKIDGIALPGEKWVPIKNTRDLYYISNLGRVFSFKTKQGLIAKSMSKKGYVTVDLCEHVEGKFRLRRRTLHLLLAEAFLENKNNLTEVNHKDGNKANYSLDNLEWCTRSENLKHAYRTGLFKRAKSQYLKINTNTMKAVEQYDKSENLIAVYRSISEASAKTGIPISSISNVMHKKKGCYTAGGYVWKKASEENAKLKKDEVLEEINLLVSKSQ